jgi:hypothetical protein
VLRRALIAAAFAALTAGLLPGRVTAAIPWGLEHLRTRGVTVPETVRFHDRILRHRSHRAVAAVARGTDPSFSSRPTG